MPTITPNFATLLSVFPLPMEQSRRHNGVVTYVHPKVPKDQITVRTYNPEILSSTNYIPEHLKMYVDDVRQTEVNRGYALIRFPDTFHWTRDYTQDAERFIPHPISCWLVAKDLCQSWGSDAVQSDAAAGPGMMVIESDDPTPVELEAVRTKQTLYFRRLINDAHGMHSKGNLKDISDLHRAGAEWMGANNLPWLPRLEQVEMKVCVGCGNEVRKQALRCERCQLDFLDHYLKWGLMPDPMQDPVVHEALTKILATRNNKAKAVVVPRIDVQSLQPGA
jgi:hypothetical protein